MKTKTATNRSDKALYALALAVASLWIVAVAAVNTDWTADFNTMVAAVASTAASAVFWAAAFRQQTVAVAVLYRVLALALVVLNASVAFGVLHKQTIDMRDHRGALAGTIAERSAQRSRLSRARVEAVVIAGEKPTETMSAEIDALAAENANRWRSTKGCTTDQITLTASAAFCSQVATLKAALAAARRRDAIDAELTALNTAANAAPAVSEADPFTPGIAQLLAAIGWPLAPDTQAMLSTLRDALRAIVLELIAAMAPAATMTLFGFGMASAPMRAQAKPRLTARVLRVANRFVPARQGAKPATRSAQDTSDPLECFLAERTEEAKGVRVAAGELWNEWVSWCHVNDIDPGTQKSLGLRLSMRYRREGTGRPRYVGLRLLPPSSRVVALRQVSASNQVR
jgi:hypothetical protein